MQTLRGLLIAAMILILIGLLAFVVTPRTFPPPPVARERLTEARVKSGLHGTLDRHRLDVGTYPPSLLGLHRATTPLALPRWRGPYLKSLNDLRDAWGQPLRYRWPGTHNPQSYDLWTLGPDGETGTRDDLTNWER